MRTNAGASVVEDASSVERLTRSSVCACEIVLARMDALFPVGKAAARASATCATFVTLLLELPKAVTCWARDTIIIKSAPMGTKGTKVGAADAEG